VEGDALPGRDELAAMANDLAAAERDGIRYIGACEVAALAADGDGLRVTLLHGDGHQEVVTVDNVVANVGYRPDSSLHRELQVHQCYASEGPMKLAATLVGASGDCLAQPTLSADVLANPEPGFFVLGSKSYGRNSQFLLRVGLEQIDGMLGLLGLTPA
jgi:hypothetical protein